MLKIISIFVEMIISFSDRTLKKIVIWTILTD